MRAFPKTVVFDLDGTLVDSQIDFQRMKDTIILRLEWAGVPQGSLSTRLSVADNMRLGTGYLLELGRMSDLREIEAGIEKEMAHIEKEALEDLREIPGARRVLSWLMDLGKRVGVLTRGSRAYAVEALRTTGMDGLIDGMVCRDDYPWWEAKPNGISLLRLLSKLEAFPRESMLVGDHLMDLQCAREAGSGFVAVLSGSSEPEDWSRAGRFPVLRSVEELPALMERYGDDLHQLLLPAEKQEGG